MITQIAVTHDQLGGDGLLFVNKYWAEEYISTDTIFILHLLEVTYYLKDLGYIPVRDYEVLKKEAYPR